VDADVELHPDALERIRAQFANDPELTAVFGSYDDRPAAAGLVSRFRNLLHHHTHSSHPGPATTFWAGCGAVRRQTFLDLGGFDAETYDRPCIEDIEFGLRLSDAGGRILLDPAIQGTHHKRWTLRSMVTTDIQQRAIPWSQLLLQRRQLPATLNITIPARISAALSLLLPLALFGLTNPVLRPSALALFSVCLGCLLLLNRDFYGLLLRRCGPVEAAIGVGLHGFVLAYSSLSFALVALVELAQRRLRLPRWLQARPALRRSLVVSGLILLALLALAAISKGLVLGWRLPGNDLSERWADWQLFSQGIYPSWTLATPEQQALPYFRTTVYLPWALPLFGALFAGGGRAQGTLIIQAVSLLSLAPIAFVGWRSLRPWGVSAAWLGGLAPLAISGNSNALAHGQFSVLCMGLITLQWLLLLRNRPLPAGLCWALAMVKPQIAASFALPFLARRRWLGLIGGLVILGGLTVVALAHTHSEPYAYLISWLQILPTFMGNANLNAASGLVGLLQRSPALAVFVLVSVSAVGFGILMQAGGQRLRGNLHTVNLLWVAEPLLLAGLCAVVGQIAFYHRNYDNIMLYPALLTALLLAFRHRRVLDVVLATLMAVSVWTPQRLLDALSSASLVQTLIWVSLGVSILTALLMSSAVQPDSRSVMG
jgi:hypothetical protein